MRALFRSICACVVALLQLAPASGHVVHHALDGEGPSHHECADSACPSKPDAGGCATATHADVPAGHDCDQCNLCDATDILFAPITPAQRAVESLAMDRAADRTVTAALTTAFSTAAPPAPPPSGPASLHAVTLPLLD